MKKKEIIWREILHRFAAKNINRFTQKELAAEFSLSLSTVFHALKIPRAIGAIEARGRFFRVKSFEKLLMLWATARNLKRDIVYQTHTDLTPIKIEGLMPPGVIFGAYSAFRLSHGETPADYDKVYVYSSAEPSEVKKRFLPARGYPNLIVLRPDRFLSRFGKVTPDVQTFVDLWNLEDWYARDYISALSKKLPL